MATSIASHYHTGQHLGQYQYACPPPSPPMDQPRCTLPSISNLIGLADAGSPTHESAPSSQLQRRSSGIRTDSRPGTGYANAFPHHHRASPPSPPMSTSASTETTSPVQRPKTHYSNASTPTGYYHETTPPLEADMQRHHTLPQTPSAHAHGPSAGSYFPPASSTSAPPPPQAQAQSSPTGLAYQQPLPKSFPPPNIRVSVARSTLGPISWQHHHYLNPAPGHQFPACQDRYICQTCNKAFSRPSSLRIHSHSHTGEKPFKCSQPGCGKAFSVRSNMKRHERGCHC